MKLTTEIITKDINSIIMGNNILFYLSIFISAIMIVSFVYLLIKHLKGAEDELYSKTNVISIGVAALICLCVSFLTPAEENNILKNNIKNENWIVSKDVPISKTHSPITDSEDYKIKYENAGYIKVNAEEYRQSKIGIDDYIVTLGTGEQIIYSSKDYTYQGELANE